MGPQLESGAQGANGKAGLMADQTPQEPVKVSEVRFTPLMGTLRLKEERSLLEVTKWQSWA